MRVFRPRPKRLRKKRNPLAHESLVLRLARHNRRGSTGTLLARDIKRQFGIQGGKCYYCLRPFPHKESVRNRLGKRYKRGYITAIYDIEHLVPISRGGSNYPYNVVLACAPCNIAKGTQTDKEFTGLVKPAFKPTVILRKANGAKTHLDPGQGVGETLEPTLHDDKPATNVGMGALAE